MTPFKSSSDGAGGSRRPAAALSVALLAAIAAGSLAGCSSDRSRTEAARQVNPNTVGLGPSGVRMPGGRF